MGYSKLPKFEILLYNVVWTGSILYLSYCVYLARRVFDYSDIGDDFTIGWNGYNKDQSDYEWRIWLPFIINMFLPWTLIHISLTELTRYLLPKAIPVVNIVVTTSFLYYYFGPICLVFAVINVTVYYFILRLKSFLLVWLCGVPMLLLSCYILDKLWEFLYLSDNLLSMMIVSTSWAHLRCMSYSVDHLSQPAAYTKVNLLDMFGYNFYFPTYFLGPFITYSVFSNNMYRPFKKWTNERIITFIFNLARYLLWTLLTDLSLYFLHIHTLQYHLNSVSRLGEWTLYGLGFLLGLFFGMKYICVYGVSGTFARFDGYAAPPPPKCVARIHLYTDMWRSFDVGFYQFMHKYIYTPLCGGQRTLTRRMLASAVCFCYVCLWHGTYLSVFIWSLLNYLGVTLVSLAKIVSKTTVYRNWEKKILTEAGSRRFAAILAAPLFVMGPTSSFYFLSDLSTGNFYINHLLFNGTWKGFITLLCVSYCMCQVSIETKIWEQNKSIKQKVKLK